jgi:hypothetical protein
MNLNEKINFQSDYNFQSEMILDEDEFKCEYDFSK